ncbi:MAG: helix-turn-helix domain-containing protein [Arcicella sp.]|jgi:AraC-like DNA-binding protein|nr:helix-turn-helix domain-containing protein [Arcicella sp.]
MKDSFSIILPENLHQELALHPLCQSLYLTEMGYRPKAFSDDRERQKDSQQYILIYCTEGEGWYQVLNQTYQVKANQFFILPAYCTHRYACNPANPWTIYWLHFFGTNARAMVNFLQGENQYSPVEVSFTESRIQLFHEIFKYTEQTLDIKNLIPACNYLNHWLITFKAKEKELVLHSDSIGKVIEFMKGNLDKVFMLSDFVSISGLSASHFSAVFKAEIKQGPMSYFNFLKVQYACQLLKDTNYPVKKIALEVGFEDAYHFARVFEKAMRVSPGKFRKRK